MNLKTFYNYEFTLRDNSKIAFDEAGQKVEKTPFSTWSFYPSGEQSEEFADGDILY